MPHVLIIEPDKLLARTYGQVLEQAGFSVAVAYEAEQAIVSADVTRPDVVVLELHLAMHDGIEFLHEFRSYSDWRGVPVILQTSMPPHEIEPFKEALSNDLGVVAFLYKSGTTLKKLVRTVRETVEAKEQAA